MKNTKTQNTETNISNSTAVGGLIFIIAAPLASILAIVTSIMFAVIQDPVNEAMIIMYIIIAVLLFVAIAVSAIELIKLLIKKSHKN